MKLFSFRLMMIFALAMFSIFSLSAQQQAQRSVIHNHFAARTFATGAIPRADLETIVLAGVRAPSARNAQPWHITVVQNLALARRIVPQTVEGNVLVIVSAPGDSITNNVEILDSALATQSIYLAAQELGYSSRIYTNPIAELNRSLRTELGLPTRHSAVAVIRIGRRDPAIDTTTAASPRRAANETVTWR